jgi:polyferredoxin
MVENLYRLQIMNTTESARAFVVEVTGLPGIHVAGEPITGVPAASSRVVPIKVRALTYGSAPGSHPIEFHVRALGPEGAEVREDSVFIVR